MSETHKRLARLIPDVNVTHHFDGRSTIDEATWGAFLALADRLEQADADRAKVERVEALHRRGGAPRTGGYYCLQDLSDWPCPTRRALTGDPHA